MNICTFLLVKRIKPSPQGQTFDFILRERANVSAQCLNLDAGTGSVVLTPFCFGPGPLCAP